MKHKNRAKVIFWLICYTYVTPDKAKTPQNQTIKRGFLYPEWGSNPHTREGAGF